jgi:hypothetical protein
MRVCLYLPESVEVDFSDLEAKGVGYALVTAIRQRGGDREDRMMSKDYERLCASTEAFIYAVMSRPMARRLARA